MLRAILIILVVGFCSSCQSVQPWERNILAKPEMQLEVDKLGAGLLNQIYFSKEASSGGDKVAGAGCGCN